MSAVFTAMFALGAVPWARSGRQGVDLLDGRLGLGDRAGGRRPRALDLGCGTGADATELARRGWAVTGVDDVPRALASARRRARDAGVDVHLVRGDVGDLAGLDLVGPRRAGEEGFRAVLDVGCLHGLGAAHRAAVARGLDAVTEPGALLAVLAWEPARRLPPLPRGLDARDLRASLPGWSLQHVEPARDDLVPRWLHRTRPTWHVLARR
ncbi:class I SAM-dependent methyltransferase [Pseudokineococcus sp. 5B2Z-1]|uniref:class I SAM-dependent methyltransferase n=1 Tax=Pseudokineococcus sp. 5B2Z-1 TaxID=3132744 RepID=UPI0030B685AC